MCVYVFKISLNFTMSENQPKKQAMLAVKLEEKKNGANE